MRGDRTCECSSNEDNGSKSVGHLGVMIELGSVVKVKDVGILEEVKHLMIVCFQSLKNVIQ